MSTPAIGAYFDGRDIIYWSRDAEGTRQLHRSRAEHSCYLAASRTPTEVVDRLRASAVVRSLKPVEGSDWLKLAVRDRDVLYRIAAPKVRDRDTGEYRPGLLHGLNVPSFEADLDPVRRWALENDVEVIRPKRCYLDLECDSRVPLEKKESARILSWTLGDDTHDPWRPNDSTGLVTDILEEDSEEAERELLLDLVEELEAYDQVVAWYGDGYDFPVLMARLERARIRIDPRRWLMVDHLPVFQRMNISSSKSGDEKQSMSLENISWSVAKMHKLPFDASKTWEWWSDGGERRAYLGRYNAHDVRCMIGIERKTGYLDLHNTVSMTTGVFPDTRASNPLRYVDNMMLKLARTRGVRLPTRYGREEADKFEGAYVFPSTPGLVRNVEVVDFASMYPSIIRSWNISFDTITEHRRDPGPKPTYLAHLPDEPKRELPEGCCESPSGAIFRREPEGLLSVGVGEALRLRKHWTKLKATFPPESPEWIDADRRSTGYKIVGNTFYGVQGCQFFRLFDVDAAEAVTLGGQWMIKAVARAAEERGMKAIGGDTDSLFIAGATRAAMGELVRYLNEEFFPTELAKMGTPRCELKLEHEKGHELMLVIAKKNYAARYAHYKGQAPDETTKPEVKGLEYKRGDTAKLARDMQAEILDVLLGGGILGLRRPDVCLDVPTFREIVLRWRARILEAPLTLDEVKISKRLKKPLEGYARKKKKDGSFAAQPPHVEVARVLAERGAPVAEGFKVDFFVVDGSCSPARVLPASDWTGDFDRFHFWETYVYPAALRVLAAAFPDPWWAQHERVRPKKIRGVLPGQGGFGFGEAPAPKVVASSPKVASSSDHETTQRPNGGRQQRRARTG